MIRKLISLIFFAFAVLFAYAFYVRYFQWRGCFNDLGRCFDADTGTVYVEQAGMVWGLFFGVSLLVAVVLWLTGTNARD